MQTLHPTERTAMRSILFSLVLLCSSSYGLVITEIMYNQPPTEADPAGTAEDLEFIELYNEKAAPEDLTGYKFTEGIHYVFAKGFQANGRPVASLGPGEYLVLARDAEAFEGRYGFAPFGQYYGRLSNSGDRIILENDAGDPYDPEADTQDRHEGARIISIEYEDDGKWPVACDGAGHTLCLVDPFRDQGDPDNWRASPAMWGTPGQHNGFQDEWIEETLFAAGGLWRYRKGTSEPPTTWKSRTYNDVGWSSGASPIGYDTSGQDPITTQLSDMQGNYRSFYARHGFSVADPGTVDDLVLYVKIDDAFVAYLNGTEVCRFNIGGSPPAYDDLSDSAQDYGGLTAYDITAYKGALVAGENVLAIQTHNGSDSSSDCFMDARLVSRSLLSAVSGGASLVINEVYFKNPFGAKFVEIYNKGGASVSLSGFSLSSDPAQLDSHQLSGVIPAHGFIAVEENEDLSLALEFQDPPPEPPDIDYGSLRIFLTHMGDGDPDTARVVAAEAFSGRMKDFWSYGRVPDGGTEWFRMSNPTHGGTNLLASTDVTTSIVINEIMYNPLKQDDPFTTLDNGATGKNLEFIELYNRGNETVDLSGWRFSRGISFTFSSTIMEPGSYLVIARNPELIRRIYGLDAGVVIGPFDGSLDNNGEKVRLRDQNNNIAEEVRYYDGGRWDSWADGLGSSLERIDPNQHGKYAGAWKASDDSDKARWTRVYYAAPHMEFNHSPYSASEFHIFMKGEGSILIDEVKFGTSASFSQNYLPSGSFDRSSDYTGNWITSSDTGGTHIDSHWTDEESYAGGGCLQIIASGRGDSGFNRFECDTSQALYRRTYYVEYYAKWVRGFNLLMTRTCGHGVAHMAEIPVPDNLGTPGARNSCYRVNLGPVFARLDQDPVVPTSSEAVVVTVEIRDSDTVIGSSIKYRRDTAASYSSAVMNDNGTGADETAGDHLWSGTIPAQPDDTVVEFYIEAVDGIGGVTQYPPLLPPDAPETVLKNLAIYRVGDRQSVGSKPVYRITLTRDGKAALDSRRTLSNHLVPCSFVLNEKEIFYNCGQRFRGSPWIRGNGNGISGGAWNGIRVQFPADHKLFGDTVEINLDTSGDDNQHDRTAYYLERKMVAGTPGVYGCWSAARYVNVRYKAGSTERNGVYDHIQKIDGEYLDYWWRDRNHGPLHKVDDWFEFNDSGGRSFNETGLLYFGNNKEAFRNHFELRDGFEIHDDFSHLMNFIYALERWSTTSLDNSIGSIMDVRQWSTILSVRLFIDDWDTVGGRRGKNAYLYLPSSVMVPSDPADPDSPEVPSQETWKLVPWDSDLTFGSSNAHVDMGSLFPNLGRLYDSRPWARRILYSDYRYLMSEVLQGSRLSAWVNWVAGSAGVGGTGIPGWCTTRANFVQGRIPSDATNSFRISTPVEDPYITDDVSVTVAGVAPLNADIFTLNGEDITGRITWTGTNNWRLSVELDEGNNTLAFAVYERNNYEIDGNLFAGSETIEVISTNERPPRIYSLDPGEGSTKGGETITVTGENFREPVSFFFGSEVADSVEIIDENELRVVTPPHPEGDATCTVVVEELEYHYDSFNYYKVNEDFYIDVADVRTSVDAVCRVPVILDFDHDSETENMGDITGWSYGICHDAGVMTPFAIELAEDTASVYPDYAILQLPENIVGSGEKNGVVVGIILDDHMQNTIPPQNNWRDVEISYLVDCPDCSGEEGTFETQVAPCETLGDPPTENVMIVGIASVSAYRVAGGTVTVDPSQGVMFIRADTNDDKTVNLADAVKILDYLFGGGEPPVVLDAADSNDDGQVNIADVVFILDYLFGQGDPPAPPYPDPGVDPTPDTL